MNFASILIPFVELAVGMSSKVAVESLSKIVVSPNLGPTKSFAVKMGTALASTVVAGIIAGYCTNKVNEVIEIVNREEEVTPPIE